MRTRSETGCEPPPHLRRLPAERPGQPSELGDGSDGSGSGEEVPLDGEVVFDGVSFTYPGTRRRVLEDPNLEVEPGEMIAIVGPTGAGKSSVVKLAARIYDPDEGAA
jgi:ABC-type multidrug transport system fused ATPase/permease subunit